MKIFFLVLLIAVAGLLLRTSKRRKSSSKYDRHLPSDWNRLSNGEDPSL